MSINLDQRPGRRFFYGWVVVLTSAFTLAIGRAVTSSFSVFYLAILEEFGWSRGRAASVMVATWVLYGIGAPIVGRLQDRVGPRKVLSTGALLLALGLGLSAAFQTQWQLYLLYAFLALGIGTLSFVPHVSLLSRWFAKGRGTAMGIAFGGAGMGTFLVVPFIQYLISYFGWRIAYLALGSIVLTLVPLTLLLLRGSPEEMGLTPDGESSRTEGRETNHALVVDREWASQVWTLGKAMRTYQFWVIVVGHLFLGLYMNMLLLHQVAHLVDAGYDKLLASFVLGLSGMLTSIGSLLGGFISDRIGREWTNTLSAILLTMSIFFLLMITDTSHPWMIYCFSVLFGLGFGFGGPAEGSTIADLFQGRDLTTILGFLEMPVGIGAGIGVWLGGYLYDLTGSYRKAFLFAIFTISVTCLGYWIAAPRKVRRVGHQIRIRSPRFRG